MAIDVKTRRIAITVDQVDPGRPCPRCGEQLQSEMKDYLVPVRVGKSLVAAHRIRAAFGYYCSGCPVVLIDGEAVGQSVAAIPSTPERFNYTVLGLAFGTKEEAPEGSYPIGEGSDVDYVFDFEQQGEQPPSAADYAAIAAANAKRERRKQKHLLANKLR